MSYVVAEVPASQLPPKVYRVSLSPQASRGAVGSSWDLAGGAVSFCPQAANCEPGSTLRGDGWIGICDGSSGGIFSFHPLRMSQALAGSAVKRAGDHGDLHHEPEDGHAGVEVRGGEEQVVGDGHPGKHADLKERDGDGVGAGGGDDAFAEGEAAHGHDGEVLEDDSEDVGEGEIEDQFGSECAGEGDAEGGNDGFRDEVADAAAGAAVEDGEAVLEEGGGIVLVAVPSRLSSRATWASCR